MFFILDSYARDLVEINGRWYIVNTIKPCDTRRWETGLTEINLEAMQNYIADEDEELTPEIIEELAEDFTGDWAVEQHVNKAQAIKRHKEICLTAELKE